MAKRRNRQVLPGGVGEAMGIITGRLSTAIQKYPSGRYGIVGSIPGDLTEPDPKAFSPGQRKSKVWDTEQDVIDALLAIGVTKFQLADCSWYQPIQSQPADCADVSELPTPEPTPEPEIQRMSEKDVFAAYARTAPLKDLQFYLRAAERKLATYVLGDETLRVIAEMTALEQELRDVPGTPALKKRVWALIDRYKTSIPGWAGNAGVKGSWAEPLESEWTYWSAHGELMKTDVDEHDLRHRIQGPLPLDRIEEWYLPIWTRAEELGRVRVPLRGQEMEPDVLRALIQHEVDKLTDGAPEPVRARPPRKVQPCPTCANATRDTARDVRTSSPNAPRSHAPSPESRASRMRRREPVPHARRRTKRTNSTAAAVCDRAVANAKRLDRSPHAPPTQQPLNTNEGDTMASFILRKVDDELWKQFRDRAQAEGHTLRWIILELISHYIRNGLPKKSKS